MRKFDIIDLAFCATNELNHFEDIFEMIQELTFRILTRFFSFGN